MYEGQHVYLNSIFMMFYGGATLMAILACVYLLLRRGNAFAPDVTPPLRLRRWTAVFFAVIALSHVWWFLLIKYCFVGAPWMSFLVASGIDTLTVWPLMAIMLINMLQDRRRPLWPITVGMAPVGAIILVSIVRHTNAFISLTTIYFLLLFAIFIIYMIYAVSQYGHWLRDNYADLEHKEVRHSLMVICICLVIHLIYMGSSNGETYEYAIQTFDYVFIGLMLWRVETLQTLDDTTQTANLEGVPALASVTHSTTIPSNIGQLLEQHCEATQLYLRHDIKLDDLCKAIGTNRNYLSHHFSLQNTTYNAYINGLRIQHFVRLYREAVADKRSFTAQQLAQESGFRSYSTFGAAFKQLMGQTVTAWMRETAE